MQDHVIIKTFWWSMSKCFLSNFSSFSQAVSEEKIFQKLTMAAMFVNKLGQKEQS